MRRLAVIAAFALAGCGPSPKPDDRIVLWEQPSPEIAARAHAIEIDGFSGRVMSESMVPLMAVGDWVTADLKFPYDKLQPGDVAIQQARWLPKDSPWLAHYCAAKLGDEWITKGLNNHAHERDQSQRMGREEYRGKVVQVYTTRKKT